MRHGMTLGELARLAKIDLGLATDLTVVPARGWTGRMYFDQTGLPFVPPSPNLRGLESLQHYPGLCLFEGTNLSVGRGSDHPFEQIGAPWLDTARVLAGLRAAAPAGVAFVAVSFRPGRPGDRKYDDTTVAGIRFTVTDRARYDPTATAVLLLSLIHRLQPTRLQWLSAQFDRLAGGLRGQIAADRSVGEILASWSTERVRFLTRRAPVLIYPR
jgi:uncharacterized protein YbbC (DUF1343 family)